MPELDPYGHTELKPISDFWWQSGGAAIGAISFGAKAEKRI